MDHLLFFFSLFASSPCRSFLRKMYREQFCQYTCGAALSTWQNDVLPKMGRHRPMEHSRTLNLKESSLDHPNSKKQQAPKTSVPEADFILQHYNKNKEKELAERKLNADDASLQQPPELRRHLEARLGKAK